MSEIIKTRAEPWFCVSEKSLQLEGLCFDRNGDLYFCDVFTGGIYKLILPEKRLEKLYELSGYKVSAVKIHKDGRLFAACIGARGGVLSLTSDGKIIDKIIDEKLGFAVNDIVFDDNGGFYFTDFKGDFSDPSGGVYYMDPGYGSIRKVIGGMAMPNGIALSPDKKSLWVTEMGANRLHHITPGPDGVTVPLAGSTIPYYFEGLAGPDSCGIDCEGNLYVAMYEQGRVLCFDPKGFPVREIILEGSKEGRYLRTTHPAIIPGSKKLVICTNDGSGDGGSWLYISDALADAYMSYQFT